MKNIYFISDAHLQFWLPDIAQEQRLQAFLNYIEADAGQLFILGDIFDFWFEWRHVIPRYYAGILSHFKQMIRSGIEIHFITGNHDFYAGQYLKNEIGIICHDEFAELEFSGKRFFLAHGDGLAKKDRGYRLLKKIIRNRFANFLFKTFVHPDLGMAIARLASRSSRKWRSNDKSSWAEEYAEFARQKLTAGYDYVLLGHIHYPMIREENGKVYCNCGDWITEFTYGRYDGNELKLLRWNATKS